MYLSQEEALSLLRALSTEGRYRETQSLCREVLARDPTQLEALEFLALSLIQLADFEEAADVLRKLMALQPMLPKYHQWLGECLIAAKQLEAARTCFEEAAGLAPESSEALCKLANCLLLQGEADAALEKGRQALSINPDSFAAHQIIGTCLSSLAVFEEAALHFKRAVELAPTRLESRLALAAVALKQGRLEESVTSYYAALLCDPGNIEVMRSLAEVLMLTGRYRQADGYLERLRVLAPEDAELRLLQGQSWERQGRFKEALAVYVDLAREQKHRKEALYLMGLSLRKLGQYDQALNCCRQVLALDETYRGVRLDAAQISAILGQDLQAWEDFHRYSTALLKSTKETDIPLLDDFSALWRQDDLREKNLVLISTGQYSEDLYFLPWLACLMPHLPCRASIACPPMLAGFARQFTQLEVHEFGSSPPPRGDYCIGLQSLPFLCHEAGYGPEFDVYRKDFSRRLMDNMPAVDLGETGTGLTIGLAWTGGAAFNGALEASLPLDRVASLLQDLDCSCYALQWEMDKAPGLASWGNQPLIDAAGHCRDYCQLAALIRQLDLVLCCDCSVAQLAAMMEVPVLLIGEPGQIAWYWNRDIEALSRGERPHYPGVQVFGPEDEQAVREALQSRLISDVMM